MSRTRTWHDLRRELRDLGAMPVRTSGSHETWKFADGRIFVVVRNHPNGSVPVGILAAFRRFRTRRGMPSGEEPAPRARAVSW